MSYSVKIEEILAKQSEQSKTIKTIEDYSEDLDNYFINGFPKGEPCGMSCLDEIFSWKKGFVYCFTGYPQSGKSEVLNWLATLRAMRKGEKIAIYSPESDEHELADQMCRLFLGQNTNSNYSGQCSFEDYQNAKQFVKEHYRFLSYDLMPSVETLLNDYTELASQGVGMFITDPFNYVAEGSMDDGRGISRYLKTALSHMKTFARVNNVINVIVEHPNQPRPNEDGTVPRVNQFRINGGAMWNNKMDCIIGMTSNFEEKTAIFETLKMKSQRYNGIRGEVLLNYDFVTGRYS